MADEPSHATIDVSYDSHHSAPLHLALTSFIQLFLGGMAIPAWAIISMVGLTYILVGAAVYLIMRKLVLQAPIENVNSYTPAMMEESGNLTP